MTDVTESVSPPSWQVMGLDDSVVDDRLPFFAEFRADLETLNRPNGISDSPPYQLKLVVDHAFEVTSPRTGRRVRSGSSILLDDLVVAYGFPDEPELMVTAGDMSFGNPLDGLLLVDERIAVFFPQSPWGSGPRHLEAIDDVISVQGWRLGRSERVDLVLGDSNFAHIAWNQLPGLQRLVDESAELTGIGVVATFEGLGPLETIFPELASTQVERPWTTPLRWLNAAGRTFVPIGGRRIPGRLRSRIVSAATTHLGSEAADVSEELANAAGPTLWVSIRSRNRTPVNQEDLLTQIGIRFFDRFPSGTLALDGHSTPADLDVNPLYNRVDADRMVAEDRAVAVAVEKRIRDRHPTSSIASLAGFTVPESIAFAQHADFSFCHHGTVQHKIGWFTSVPGVVHSNEEVTASQPGRWLADQSEVAVAPSYVPIEWISDVDPDAADPRLRNGNYLITDVGAVAEFVLDAMQARLSTDG